ncbi:hypothetical protein GGQ87_002888 [Brevundimonas alba]|uniref:Uncharacterized protein n=1 Tax=Brevundimonas alba TaxID=74314 RepID=A0A7X6BNW1_9CAUL|nr:hypothetical protein [Brevundimonas alba]NJC42593.1 hypothetical protein [Brevundimonas alba]
MIRRLGLTVALTLAGAGSAWAQTPPAGVPPQDPPTTTVEDVIVSGETLEERASTFVDEVAQPVRQRGLARWSEPACFGVVNFQGDAARQIADQLVARADELGLPAGELDCEPNVFIIGAVDAPAVARAWVERSPEVFRPRYSGGAAGRHVLDDFTTSDAAVRWWHLSVPIDYDIVTQEIQPAVRMPGRAAPIINVYSKSQQASRVRDDLQKVMVLVDVEKLGTVTTEQLCDYLLMVAYAQIDPEGETAAYDTILNLFEDPSVPGLTTWDRSYLTSLYDYDPTRRAGVGAQGDRLADEIRRTEATAAE